MFVILIKYRDLYVKEHEVTLLTYSKTNTNYILINKVLEVTFIFTPTACRRPSAYLHI